MKNVFFLLLFIQFVVFTSCAQSSDKGTDTAGGTEHLTLETFKKKVFDFEKNQQWVYEGDMPAIIDFYADWCRPCKMVAPILEELAQEYKGKIKIYKVDTQAEQQLATMLGIESLPSILFIPKSGQPSMSVGAYPKEQFKEHIKNILKVE